MCLDVIGCHAVDTVIFGGGIRPIVLARSLMPACFKQSPARRAWEAPTRWRFAIACSVPACLLPIMPCRSLRSSLVRYCRLVMATMPSPPPPRHGHDVIGRLVIEPIPPRHIITPRCLPPSVPFPFHVPIAPRLACFAPVIRPIARYHHAVPSARLPPHHHLGVVISSSRLRVMPSPPDAPPMLVEERGGATGRLLAVRLSSPCLLGSCCFPASCDLALAHLVPSSRASLLAHMCRRRRRVEPCGRFACFAVGAF